MSLQENSVLRRRFLGLRPGRDLVAIIDAAIPVLDLEVDVLAQERKPLPLTEEFVLRLLHANVNDLDEMASLLGLERDLVEAAATEQFALGNVQYKGRTQQLALTPRGKEVVVDCVSVQPVEVTLSLTFDRVTWSATEYPRPELIQRREVEEEALVLIPAESSARPGLADVTVNRINELLRIKAEDSKSEILTVRKVRHKRPRYLPIKLLVYADSSRDDVDVAVCIDGDLSPAHDEIIAHRGGAAALDITLIDEKSQPAVDDAVERLLTTHQTEDALEPGADHAPPEAAPVAESGVGVEPNDIQEAVDRVEMYEHAEILRDSLRSAQGRLLILSPWVQGSVVNTNFLGLLESRLRAKVRVHIAYGFGGPVAQKNDEQALERLNHLADRYPDHFTLIVLKNSHAKILICDGMMVTTSFNWLSFKGAKNREYRIEEGLRVRIPAVVDESYQHYLRLLVTEAAES